MKKLLLVLTLCASPAFAQQGTGSLKGQVLDELGGAIVGATVVAVDGKGVEKTVVTNGGGTYTINGLAPGRYTLRASTAGFAVYENTEVDVVAGRPQQLDITLKVSIEEQKVTVASDSTSLSTEPENNAGAVVLKGADIDSLPDDPDDLAAALQALAGPSAGPNGGQIFIDGFSNGRLPPRSSIREIRINSNPFSAEYDRLGFGRIEILTKPGSDRFRGSGSFGYNNNKFNSRNPYALTRPPYQSRNYGANLSGPISKKKASFFFDFEKRDVNDQAIINATILDSNLNIVSFGETVPTPSRRISVNPRIDYQINKSNTLVARYSYEHTSRIQGVGGFSLDSRKYSNTGSEHQIQLTETAVINKTVVNETRFQFRHEPSASNANNTIPTINVLEAFVGGGSQVGLASNTQSFWELQNNTSMTEGRHALRFGVRFRHTNIKDISPQGFGGTWTFGGAVGPVLDANNQIVIDPQTGLPLLTELTSIERYRRTLLFQQQGKTGPEIRLLGGGATQFSISAGNPLATVSQLDFGGFAQDDWKVRPNLTLNLGLRYENQDNISSNLNFAPRFGFAWSPGNAQQAKMVIRGGFGVFYDRVSENLTLTAERFNGINQQQYSVVGNAILNLFPNVPSAADLAAFAVPISTYQLATNIQAPYTTQGVISVERQLPHSFTMAVSYINARTLHLLRGHAVNAPLPGTFVPSIPNSGVRPSPNLGNVFQYESSGRSNQNQLIVTLSHRLSRSASLNAFYVLAKTNSDTDGTGTYSANPYDFTGEFGRSSQDVRHRFVMTGSFRLPWGVSLNPFVIVSSGAPFNITLGRDLNGDTLYTERPSFAPPGADCDAVNIRCTPFGNFNLTPALGETLIPRNFGNGPSSLSTRLGINKTFAFGKERGSSAQNNPGGAGGRGDGAAGGGRGPGGIPGMGGMGGGRPGGGGASGGGGRGGGGFGGGGGGGDQSKRYSLTFSINIQNVLNHTNLGRPTGNLSSSFFGRANSGGGNFGGGGGGGPFNRRIDLQVRFSF
jgi:hypothetical protein